MTRINGEEIHSVDTIGGVLAYNAKRGSNRGFNKSALDRALNAWLLRHDHATRLPGEYGTRSIYPSGKKRPEGPRIVRVKRTELSRAQRRDKGALSARKAGHNEKENNDRPLQQCGSRQ